MADESNTDTYTWQKGIDRKKKLFLEHYSDLICICIFIAILKSGFIVVLLLFVFILFFFGVVVKLALYLWVLWVVTGYSSILWLILWCSQLSNPHFPWETFVFVTALLFDTITYVRSYRFQIFIRFAVFSHKKTVSQLRSWCSMYNIPKIDRKSIENNRNLNCIHSVATSPFLFGFYIRKGSTHKTLGYK